MSRAEFRRGLIYTGVLVIAFALWVWLTEPECSCSMGGNYGPGRLDPADCPEHGVVVMP